MLGVRDEAQRNLNRWVQTLEQKRLRALASWALRRMGNRWPRYQAKELFFWLNYLFLLSCEKYDPIAALEKAPLDYPDRLQGKIKKIDPHRLLKDYEEYLPRIARNKKRNWSDRKFQRENLAEILLGATKAELTEYIAEPKAPVVVYKYLLRQYKLDFGWENLKKLLGRARREEIVLRKITERGEKQRKDVELLLQEIKKLA